MIGIPTKQFFYTVMLLTFSLLSPIVTGADLDLEEHQKTMKKVISGKRKPRVQKESLDYTFSRKVQGRYETERKLAGQSTDVEIEQTLSKKIRGQYDQERDPARVAEEEAKDQRDNMESPVDRGEIKRWKYDPKSDQLE